MANRQVRPAYGNNSLLYWVTLAYVVGIPNLVHFDTTGRTADPINFTSVMNILQTFVTGYLLAVLLLLERKSIFGRKIHIRLWLWVALFLQFTLASLLQPAFRLTPAVSTDLLLSFFLLTQWLIAFILVAVLYSRAPAERATELIAGLIGRACWIWLAMVWLILPIMPGQVYGASDETSTTIRQLGGELIHPGKLANLAGIAFFYALFFFPQGPRRWAACSIAFLTLALTAARTGELSFMIALLLYMLFFSGKTVLRWIAVFSTVPALVVAFALRTSLMRYIARGQSTQSLASLDDRTRVWQASLEAFYQRPYLGYGFVVGPRKALRDHWHYTHWIPPHAHNELIGTLMSGGVLAAIVLVCVYAIVFVKLCRDARRGIYEIFLLVVYLQAFVTAFSGPIFSYRFGVMGGIFLMCCIAALGRSRSSRDINDVGARTNHSTPSLSGTREMSAV